MKFWPTCRHERMDMMKSIKLIIALLLLGAFGIGNAWADRGYHRSGVSVGVMVGPYWGAPYFPYYSPFPYYYPPYYPPVVIERSAPQVYIEQRPAAPVATAPVSYWYYCVAAKGYYPYVKECPGGWQKVAPTPPGHP